MNTLNVKFKLPKNVVSQSGLDPNNINKDVKRILAIFLYKHKYISLSKACEIGDMTQWEFYETNKRLGIEILYSKEDLKKDRSRKWWADADDFWKVLENDEKGICN
jgi:predicted HTH domain antitoxin